MTQGVAQVGESELWWELSGEPGAPIFLLIPGLGGSSLDWRDQFCDVLTAAGYGVLRFDPRDTGRSTKQEWPVPDVVAAMQGDFSTALYSLNDLAGDAVGLLDALDIERAHIVGFSLGGSLAQLIALDHTDRVATLASLSSTTGADDVGQPSAAAQVAIAASVSPTTPRSREEVIDRWLERRRLWAGPGWPFDERAEREHLSRVYERGIFPMGRARQLIAFTMAPDRTPRLGGVKVPTVVIHGDADPLIDVSGGEATAAAIPDARLVIVGGMGHELPVGAWPQITTAMITNAQLGV